MGDTSGRIVSIRVYSLNTVCIWTRAKVDLFTALGMSGMTRCLGHTYKLIAGLYYSCIRNTDMFEDGVLRREYTQRVTESLV